MATIRKNTQKKAEGLNELFHQAKEDLISSGGETDDMNRIEFDQAKRKFVETSINAVIADLYKISNSYSLWQQIELRLAPQDNIVFRLTIRKGSKLVTMFHIIGDRFPPKSACWRSIRREARRYSVQVTECIEICANYIKLIGTINRTLKNEIHAMEQDYKRCRKSLQECNEAVTHMILEMWKKDQPMSPIWIAQEA